VAFVVVSRAPLDALVAYKRRMGWDFRWVSSYGSSFNYDFHATIDQAVARLNITSRTSCSSRQRTSPGATGRASSRYERVRAAGDDVFHTYSAYARGFDGLWAMWQWLDRTPLGRNEGDMSWFHRHDEYPATAGEPS